MVDQPGGALRVQALVIVPSIEMAAEALPMIGDDRRGWLAPHREDVEPEQHRPNAVLLADMIGAGAGALFAAQRDAAGIEQRAKIFPARRRLVAVDPERLGDAIDSAAGRHRARDPRQPPFEPRHEPRIDRKDCEAVARADHIAAPHHHVAVAVAIGGGAEIGALRIHHRADQRRGVERVGVGVMAIEIGQRLGIHRSAGGRAEPPPSG